MTHQPQVAHCQPTPSMITQKVQLIFKLFLLENARNAVEQELLKLTNKAYEEVQDFFSSSFPASVFSELAKALDSKCQAVNEISALLKDLTAEPHVCVRNGVRRNQPHPFGYKGIIMADVLRFGHMLQNSLIVSSVARAVQVLGVAPPLQKLKHFFIPLPAVFQQDVTVHNSASSCNSTVATISSSPYLKAEETEHVFEQKHTPDSATLSPAVIHSPKIGPERPPLLLPHTETLFPEISNPSPVEITQISWECVDDIQVQHQKQTSSQLLHFLRAKVKNMGTLEVMKQSKEGAYTSSSPTLMSPTAKIQTYHLKHAAADDLIDTQGPKTLSAGIINQAPVFKVKRSESSGGLTYTYMTATKTELWDIGDIFTEVEQGDSEAIQFEDDACGNMRAEEADSCGNVHLKAQTMQSVEPEHDVSSAAAAKPAINGITIPDFQLRRFEETEVVVSHIVTPSNFYIQQADSTQKLQAFITDSWTASSSYAEQNFIPDIGTKVMGWFPNQEQWCRAQVTKICGVSEDHNNATDGAKSETSIKVEVKRLDHGDTTCLSLWNIKELTPKMATLPLQAVQVSLANVTPANGSNWSEEAVNWFHAMVHNRMLYARVYPQGPEVTAELFLEKGRIRAMRRGASLSLRLAQNGHAKHIILRNPCLKKRSTIQDKMRKQDSDWEKYLISCYTQSMK